MEQFGILLMQVVRQH